MACSDRLETKSLVLRPFELGDAAAAYVLSNEPSAREWLPSQVYADEAAARAVLEFLIEQHAEPADPRRGPYVLAVEHRGEGVLIGHVGLSPFEGDVEIGFGIAEAFQRRGLAVEAVGAVCRWAFGRFGLPRILAIAAQGNRGSRKVLVRAGFEYEGDRVMCFQGTEQAVSVYSLIGRGDLSLRTGPIYGLAGWLAICFTAAAIGAAASVQAAGFYAGLVRPEWAPPSSVFGPVWTVLYALMAVSAWLVWRVRGDRGARVALFIFLLQLVLNSLWSWLFFHWHLGALSFVDIMVLLALIVATLALFWRIRPLAGALLVPYLLWVAFASMLNYTIWQLNPSTLT